MKYQPSGQAVANFSMATTEAWTGQDGEKHERTTWWRVSVFGKQAETVNQYLKKGSKVYVEGRLMADPKTGSPRVFEKKDKTFGAAFEVTASLIKFLSTRTEGGQASADAPAHEAEPDNIPF